VTLFESLLLPSNAQRDAVLNHVNPIAKQRIFQEIEYDEAHNQPA
jgi:hypothetical protein